MATVVLVELTPVIPSLGRSIVMPRSGLLTIASILAERTSHKVELLFEPYVGGLDPQDIARKEPQYVLVNGLTTTALRTRLFIAQLRKIMKTPVTVIAGGEHATMFPKDARTYADFVLRWEGDIGVTALLKALDQGDRQRGDEELAAIPGLVWEDTAGCEQQNPIAGRVQPINYRYNFSVVAGASEASSRYRLSQLPVQTSRGCLYACSFCSWIGLFGKSGYMVRPVEDVVHDVEHGMDYTGIINFMIVDNLFGGNLEYTEDLLGSIVRAFEFRQMRPTFTVLCRADQIIAGPRVFSNSLLTLMGRAGVTHVSLGIESLNRQSLLSMKKGSNVTLYRAAADRLRHFGFKIDATYVTGYGDETLQDVHSIAEFSCEMGCFTIQVYAHAITPGVPDSRNDVHRQIPYSWTPFANGHAVTTFPRKMLPSILQRSIFDTASRFYSQSGPEKRLVGRIYRQIERAFLPYQLALEEIERDVLLPMEIYKQERGDFILNEQRLLRVINDQQHVADFSSKIRAVFEHAIYAAPSTLPGAGRGRGPA